ncbi:MAG TPA: hypothetical protein VFO60_10295 [Candidatus Dormibacteraeota bacterium]|nr:hypothetical protein [Candidatus Dormibacteraeota bacterium]
MSHDLMASFQQLTPALMAKGVEDTALYRETALLARGDVGCDPDRPPATPEDFHAWCEQAQRCSPLSLLATSTHDSKRSEDVRARLCALSAVAAEWAQTVRSWADRHRGLDPGGDALGVLLQTLVGAWPIDACRAGDYLVKAMREAKERTSWTAVVDAYEARLRLMAAELLDDPAFVAELEAVVGRVRPAGERISLAWALLRLTAPGVPDTYQGCELWDRSLVDPDNRRPVDLDAREALLGRALAAPAAELLRDEPEGLAKLAVVARALHLRQRRPSDFGPDGDYRRLDAAGPFADRCLAFARGRRPGAVTVAPVRPLPGGGGWGGTSVTLPEGLWANLLGGGEAIVGTAVEVEGLLTRFPVALLERVDDRPGPAG